MKRTERTRKTEEPELDLSQVRVQLKPVFGLHPGVYMTALYALAAALLLFFLLVYPGIRSNGTYVTVTSRPEGAAIAVDGVYRGATPAEVLVARGERKIEISRPFHRTQVVERDFRGPVFATLVFKPRERIAVDLELLDPRGFFASRLEDLAAYAHEPGASSLADTARVIRSPKIWGATMVADELDSYLEAAMPFLSPGTGGLSDFLEAKAIAASEGGVLTSGGLAELVRSLASLASSRSFLLYWILLNLPDESAQEVMKEPWFAALHERLVGALPASVARTRSSPAAPLVVAGVSLRPIPGGIAVIGDDTSERVRAQSISLEQAHAVTVGAFLMGETEVTNRQYAAFLSDEPLWRKANRSELESRGLVEEQYLATWTSDTPPAGTEDHPVTHVSYHAAAAFCEWLQGKLPASLRGSVARLPFEAEWEWAARGGAAGTAYPGGGNPGDAPFRSAAPDGPVRAGSTSANGYGLREVMGNVWEWCRDWYAPASYLMVSADPARNTPDTSVIVPGGTGKVVRGGSWANDSRQATLSTRGSQPPSWTTPYLGFRVVVAPATP